MCVRSPPAPRAALPAHLRHLHPHPLSRRRHRHLGCRPVATPRRPRSAPRGGPGAGQPKKPLQAAPPPRRALPRQRRRLGPRCVGRGRAVLHVGRLAVVVRLEHLPVLLPRVVRAPPLVRVELRRRAPHPHVRRRRGHAAHGPPVAPARPQVERVPLPSVLEVLVRRAVLRHQEAMEARQGEEEGSGGHCGEEAGGS